MSIIQAPVTCHHTSTMRSAKRTANNGSLASVRSVGNWGLSQ